MKYPCPACRKGWLPPRVIDGWPVMCGVCVGQGELSTPKVARLLGFSPTTIRRVEKCGVIRAGTYHKLTNAIESFYYFFLPA